MIHKATGQSVRESLQEMTSCQQEAAVSMGGLQDDIMLLRVVGWWGQDQDDQREQSHNRGIRRLQETTTASDSESNTDRSFNLLHPLRNTHTASSQCFTR